MMGEGREVIRRKPNFRAAAIFERRHEGPDRVLKALGSRFRSGKRPETLSEMPRNERMPIPGSRRIGLGLVQRGGSAQSLDIVSLAIGEGPRAEIQWEWEALHCCGENSVSSADQD